MKSINVQISFMFVNIQVFNIYTSFINQLFEQTFTEDLLCIRLWGTNTKNIVSILRELITC